MPDGFLEFFLADRPGFGDRSGTLVAVLTEEAGKLTGCQAHARVQLQRRCIDVRRNVPSPAFKSADHVHAEICDVASEQDDQKDRD
jgi:hypothetical protein